MDDTAKYLIHADITADGVVERSDVVGAVFGQTEGLLGDELDLRDLQQSSKVGRIDVQIESENGQSYGTITIASSLDKVETSILAAALETISRVGPCRASVSVASIEDVRAAKRREVVDRAKELLASSFDEDVMSSEELLGEVRESVRAEEISDYRGVPAGPRVADSDAIIVVEGRADVLTLLRYGVKNAVAVEGTNVPDAVADLTLERTVTAFLDGDRGGDLIRKELAQVGDVDYVAFAPSDRSVEDLARHDVMSALRDKQPSDELAGEADAEGQAATAATDGSTLPAPESAVDGSALAEGTATPTEPDEREESAAADRPDETDLDGATDGADADETPREDDRPETLRGHVDAVIGDETDAVRLLTDEFATLSETAAVDAFDAVEGATQVPYAVVLDGALGQRVLDVASQRGVDQVVAREMGEFTKQPTDVRIRTAEDVATSSGR